MVSHIQLIIESHTTDNGESPTTDNGESHTTDNTLQTISISLFFPEMCMPYKWVILPYIFDTPSYTVSSLT